MPETIFWWVFTLACIFGFFFAYGIIESWIREWVASRQTRKQVSRAIDNSPEPKGNGYGDSLLH